MHVVILSLPKKAEATLVVMDSANGVGYWRISRRAGNQLSGEIVVRDSLSVTLSVCVSDCLCVSVCVYVCVCVCVCVWLRQLYFILILQPVSQPGPARLALFQAAELA